MQLPYQKENTGKILIIDDEEVICELIQDILEREGYHCITASSAHEATDRINEHDFDLVLSDIQMPGRSGLELVRDILEKDRDIAIIMVTATNDPGMAEAVFEIGVYDYITKPINRSSVLISVKNSLHRRDLEIANKNYQEGLERMVAERTTSLSKITQQLQDTIDGVIQTIALTVETRDPYTAGHQRRVANLARTIAREMELPEESVEGIFFAGLIHDLGKISVPAEILSKPGRLTENEFNLIKDHPQTGYGILKDIKFPWPIAHMVIQHHERYDGSGYPNGLAKDETLLEARIISVADVVEAIASHRPYRPSLGIEMAFDEISKNAGIKYDPDITEICLKLFSEKKFNF